LPQPPPEIPVRHPHPPTPPPAIKSSRRRYLPWRTHWRFLRYMSTKWLMPSLRCSKVVQTSVGLSALSGCAISSDGRGKRHGTDRLPGLEPRRAARSSVGLGTFSCHYPTLNHAQFKLALSFTHASAERKSPHPKCFFHLIMQRYTLCVQEAQRFSRAGSRKSLATPCGPSRPCSPCTPP